MTKIIKIEGYPRKIKMNFVEMTRVYHDLYIGGPITEFLEAYPSPKFRRENWDENPWKYNWDYIYLEVDSIEGPFYLRKKSGVITRYIADTYDVLADDWIEVGEDYV